ncbi:MAG: hypothetical protein AAF125_13525, partial [Chloroflexota bacterium]
MQKLRTLAGVLFTALTVTVVAAQPTVCEPLIAVAMGALEENCSEVERNTACYGYNNVTATFAEDV